METVWRVTLFYGDFIVELFWRLSGAFMENLYEENISKESITLYTITILHIMETKYFFQWL